MIWKKELKAEGTEGTVAKFADDTKICRGAGSNEEAGDCRRTWTD